MSPRHLDPHVTSRPPAAPPHRACGRSAIASACVLAGALAASAVLGARQGAAPVRSEFRIFAGATEVTGHTRLRLAPAGVTGPGTIVEPGVPIALPPGLYDAQAVRMHDDRVVAIRRAERVVIVRYPDEGDLHLEVFNFDPRFGALQLRATAAGSRTPDYSAVAYDPADHDRPIASGLRGEAYVLLVAPGGLYDIRLAADPEPGAPTRADLWLLGVEIQADRTRLKLLPPDWGRLAAARCP